MKNAVLLADKNSFKSIAFPLIGAGSGGYNQEKVKTLMLDELGKLDVPMSGEDRGVQEVSKMRVVRMGVSIYYTARRSNCLSQSEQKAIEEIVVQVFRKGPDRAVSSNGSGLSRRRLLPVSSTTR